MGEGTTRVVATNGSGTRVRELGEEITQVRGRLDALVVELDRRRHRVTNVKRHLRRHGRSAAVVGGLILAALAIAPVVLVRTRFTRRRTWSHKAAKLRDKASRLGRALGRVAQDPERLAPPPAIFGPKTVVAVVLTLAQILVPRLLAPRAEHRP
jgi:hypothetical protein